MQDVLVVGKEFYDLPVKEKEGFYSEDPNQNCRLKSSINYDKEKVHFWRDSFRHPCHPLEDYIHEWPQNPTQYRYKDITCQNYSSQSQICIIWTSLSSCSGDRNLLLP